MVEAERIIKKLKCLKKSIEQSLDELVDPTEMLIKFEGLIDELPEEAEETAEKYRILWAGFWQKTVRILDNERHKIARENKNETMIKNDLPKLILNKHNGHIETFNHFWSMFEDTILKRNDVTAEDKLSHLRGIVAERDQPNTADMNLNDVKIFLFKKYRSPDAIRLHIQEKFSNIRMRYNKDTNNLLKLAEALEPAIKLAKTSDPDAPELLVLLFNVVYGRISSELRDKFWDTQPDRKSCPENLLIFIEKKRHDILADQVARMSIGGKLTQFIGNRNKNGERICNYCHDEKNPHLATDCPVKKKLICFKCNLPGHIARQCENKIVKPYSKTINDSEIYIKKSQIGLITQSLNDDPRPHCTIKLGKSEINGLIDSGSLITIFPKNFVNNDHSTPIKCFTQADGTSCLWVKGPIETEFEINKINFKYPVYIQETDDIIIGADFLKKNKAKIDMENSSLLLFNQTKDENKRIEIDPKFNNEKLICENLVNEEFPELLTGIGKCELVKHEIDTGNTKPITIRQRRVPIAYMEEIAKHVEELLKEDIIEESNSDWHFPFVTVRKKDGTMRLAIDFRPLNDITRKDAFPMPRIDEILEKMTDARIFSRLDLRKGYYQILLNEKDKEKTAFSFKGKLYHFKRMPFGLCCAPQTFQRMMKKILGDLQFIEIYLDDVIIYSSNYEQHLEHLRIVLERIRTANLKLNKEKCKFGKPEIEFLGFRIVNGQKFPNDEKTKIFANFPTPNTKKLLKGFLGLANYIRRMIPNFAELAKPLFEASNKKKFLWNDVCEKNFQILKDKLSKEPMTYLPDFSKPFIVTCDASEIGMGAVLAQEIDGKRQVIEFLSKTFNPVEKRYSTIEREASAIMFALEKWQHYLKGIEFIVESDHKPLKWLLSMSNCEGKLGRMARYLQGEYMIKGIEYVKGEENLLADTLSRIEIGLINEISGSTSQKLKTLMEKDPNRFILINNRPYLVEKNQKRLCIDSDTEQKRILKEVHDNSGHFGIFKCQELIRQRFYWPNWSNDLKRYIKNCFSCNERKDDIEPYQEELMLQDSTEVFERLHLDLGGPLTVSNNCKYFIIGMCAYSKWMEAALMNDTSTSSIKNWLKNQIFSRFGEPEMITVDQGSQFESSEFKEFCDNLNIKYHIISTHHHQSNGLAERAIQTLQKEIRTTTENQEDWSLVLPQCVYSYNTSKHRTTGVTPFSLMFGREAKIKLDRMFNLERPEIDAEINKTIAKINRETENLKTKKYYDRKLKKSKVKQTDLVMWHSEEQGLGKSRKLNKRWKGPFRVVKINRPLAILMDRHGKEKRIHLNHIKSIETNQPLAEFRSRGRPRNLRGGIMVVTP